MAFATTLPRLPLAAGTRPPLPRRPLPLPSRLLASTPSHPARPPSPTALLVRSPLRSSPLTRPSAPEMSKPLGLLLLRLASMSSLLAPRLP
jgi:hypothetical protein